MYEKNVDQTRGTVSVGLKHRALPVEEKAICFRRSGRNLNEHLRYVKISGYRKRGCELTTILENREE